MKKLPRIWIGVCALLLILGSTGFAGQIEVNLEADISGPIMVLLSTIEYSEWQSQGPAASAVDIQEGYSLEGYSITVPAGRYVILAQLMMGFQFIEGHSEPITVDDKGVSQVSIPIGQSFGKLEVRIDTDSPWNESLFISVSDSSGEDVGGGFLLEGADSLVLLLPPGRYNVGVVDFMTMSKSEVGTVELSSGSSEVCLISSSEFAAQEFAWDDSLDLDYSDSEDDYSGPGWDESYDTAYSDSEYDYYEPNWEESSEVGSVTVILSERGQALRHDVSLYLEDRHSYWHWLERTGEGYVGEMPEGKYDLVVQYSSPVPLWVVVQGVEVVAYQDTEVVCDLADVFGTLQFDASDVSLLQGATAWFYDYEEEPYAVIPIPSGGMFEDVPIGRQLIEVRHANGSLLAREWVDVEAAQSVTIPIQEPDMITLVPVSVRVVLGDGEGWQPEYRAEVSVFNFQGELVTTLEEQNGAYVGKVRPGHYEIVAAVYGESYMENSSDVLVDESAPISVDVTVYPSSLFYW